jgi:hypothetical protein
MTSCAMIFELDQRVSSSAWCRLRSVGVTSLINCDLKCPHNAAGAVHVQPSPSLVGSIQASVETSESLTTDASAEHERCTELSPAADACSGSGRRTDVPV